MANRMFITLIQVAQYASMGLSETDAYLLTPQITLDNNSTLTWWHVADWDGEETRFSNGTYDVLLSTTDNNILSFTEPLGQFAPNDTLWSEQSIDLSAYTGQKVFVAFHVTKYDYLDWGIDDLTVSEANSISAIETDATINVYPNPNNGVFNINVNTDKASDLSIELMNTQGQVIYKDAVNAVSKYNQSIDVQGFAKGVYFLRVNTGNEVRMNKVVIR